LFFNESFALGVVAVAGSRLRPSTQVLRACAKLELASRMEVGYQAYENRGWSSSVGISCLSAARPAPHLVEPFERSVHHIRAAMACSSSPLALA
jgi:hypothetical protein